MNVRLIPASVGVKYGAADLAKLRSIGVLPVVVNDCYLQNKFRPERVHRAEVVGGHSRIEGYGDRHEALRPRVKRCGAGLCTYPSRSA